MVDEAGDVPPPMGPRVSSSRDDVLAARAPTAVTRCPTSVRKEAASAFVSEAAADGLPGGVAAAARPARAAVAAPASASCHEIAKPYAGMKIQPVAVQHRAFNRQKKRIVTGQSCIHFGGLPGRQRAAAAARACAPPWEEGGIGLRRGSRRLRSGGGAPTAAHSGGRRPGSCLHTKISKRKVERSFSDTTGGVLLEPLPH